MFTFYKVGTHVISTNKVARICKIAMSNYANENVGNANVFVQTRKIKVISLLIISVVIVV